MLIDALILAGGRSSRLGSVPKAQLGYREHTLLENTVATVRGLRSTVVVGDVTAQSLSAEVLVTREEPAFAGPAAAIGAGLDRLREAHPVASELTLVLACDMPEVAAAVPLLLAGLSELREPGDHDDQDDQDFRADGLIAVDPEHRLQPLLAAYRTEALAAAVASQRELGVLEGLSVFQLIRALALRELAVPGDASADVDTWADAARWGIERPDTANETLRTKLRPSSIRLQRSKNDQRR